MDDKNNQKFNREEKIEKKIEKSKKDVPLTERINKMQAPDPWPDPPPATKKNSNSDDK